MIKDKKSVSTGGINGDRWFKNITLLFALAIPLIFLAIVTILILNSWLSITKLGWGFLWGVKWDPLNDVYGALPFIYGTLMTSLIALLIAVPLGLGCSTYLTEVLHSNFREYIATLIELLAAIPSVIYGLWGIFVLGPWLANSVEPFLKVTLGFIPFFQGPTSGLSMLSGGVILAIMILPTITSISREVFQAVPQSLRESALALGATRWEMIKLAVAGPSWSGVIGAIILGLGRALGETMAVTMVIGNRSQISASIFSPGYSLAAVIANEFAEATSDLNLSVLIELALILFIITLLINGLARLLIWKTIGERTSS